MKTGLVLGCGYKKRESTKEIKWINCDISAEVKPDVVCDITKKLPFKDNSVDEIFISHVLEHTREPVKVLKEFYRVCKNNALIEIRVPYFSSESAFSNLTHKSFFTWTSFDFLEPDHSCHWQGVGNFEIISKKLKWRKIFKPLELLFNMFPRIYQELFCWWFPAKELRIKLRVVK